MPEPTRILVSGSRTWSSPETIRRVFTEDARRYRSVTLVHGQCDPHHPRTGQPVRWATATHVAREDQLRLYGADWLSDLIAAELGWQTEAHPADWQAPCRPTCQPGHRKVNRDGQEFCPAAGDYRNAVMAASGIKAMRAFVDPCAKWRCRRPHPHDSHGTANAIRLARMGGIPIRIERSTRTEQLTMEVPGA